MTTRSQSNKQQIDDTYKKTIGIPITQNTEDTCISIPVEPNKSVPRQIDFDLDDTTASDSTNPFVPYSDIEPTGKGENFLKMSQNPLATLKYAVEAVLFFDGSNTSLSYFIEGCEEAKSMLPVEAVEAEAQLTKVIRTRIVGEARRTIQGQNFDSIAQLTAYLKQIYGPVKNVYQLQGELGSVYQKNEEDVVTYANRVKLLGKKILEAYKVSVHSQVNSGIKESVEKDMAKCFIRGLKPEIEQRITRDLDVEGTITDALRIERELHIMTDLRQGISSRNKALTSIITNGSCQICHKEGHITSNCRRINQNNIKTDLGNEILICQICKKRGHGAEKCRFRDSHESSSKDCSRKCSDLSTLFKTRSRCQSMQK